MSVTVELYEADRRPETDVAVVGPGDTIRIVKTDAVPPLRRFLLRGGDRTLAEPGEQTLLWLRVPDRPNDPLRVLQLDREVAGDPARRAEDDLLIPIEQDALLPRRSELLLQPVGGPTQQLVLRIVDRRGPALGALGDIDGGLAGPGDEGGAPDWELPGLRESVLEPAMAWVDAWTERIRQRIRVPTAMPRYATSMLLVLGLVGYSCVQQRSARSSEDRAVAAEASSAQAREAAGASAEDAGACRAEVAALHKALLDPKQARRLIVASVLDSTRARAAVLASVPADPEREAAMDRADRERAVLVRSVDHRLDELPPDPEARAWAAARLEASEAFEGTLPEYGVLWHPRPFRREEAAMTGAGLGGGSLRGPWGLGERALRLVGGFEDELAREDPADPRLQTQWSVRTLSTALTAVQDTLLALRVGGRLSVPPEEIHLWSLALFHAYNELPPSGVEGGIEPCVQLLLEGAAEGQTAEPGQAVLPSVVDVAEQEGFLRPLRRSADCPWREDALVAGAELALQAATEAAGVRARE